MSGAGWSGRKVRRLVDLTLMAKGTTCHLCGLEGANSADHDPPRDDLLRAGVPDPDALVFLWPAHRLPCNIARGKRPITDDLRAELRRKREAFIAAGSPSAGLSPRFRARFPHPNTPAEAPVLPFSPRSPTKNENG
jgi:hypothetical protein